MPLVGPRGQIGTGRGTATPGGHSRHRHQRGAVGRARYHTDRWRRRALRPRCRWWGHGVRSEQVEELLRLGGTAVIATNEEPLAERATILTGGEGVRYALDAVGGATGSDRNRSRNCYAWGAQPSSPPTRSRWQSALPY